MPPAPAAPPVFVAAAGPRPAMLGGLRAAREGGGPSVDRWTPRRRRPNPPRRRSLEKTSRMIERHLKNFGVEVTVIAAMPGPVVTRFEIEPAVGVKGSQIVNLAKDLARSLSPGVDPAWSRRFRAATAWRWSCPTASAR